MQAQLKLLSVETLLVETPSVETLRDGRMVAGLAGNGANGSLNRVDFDILLL